LPATTAAIAEGINVNVTLIFSSRQYPAARDAVFFGAEVELENVANGELLRYRIVGPDETDAQRGWISIDAPLARAMLKKRVDDEFEAQLPGGVVRFAIIEIGYND